MSEKELDPLIESFFDHIDFKSLPPDYAERDFERERVQKNCALIEVKNNTPKINAPYKDVHSRYPDFKYCLYKFLEKNKVKDFKFLIVLNDGMEMKVPSLSPNRLQKKFINNIPIPMGNQRGLGLGNGTPIQNWDDYVEKFYWSTHKEYPWSSKKNQAVFRGQFSHQTWKVGHWSKVRAQDWTEVNRGLLYKTCEHNPFFDVGFHRVSQDKGENIPITSAIPFKDQQNYKFIINVGCNIDWAERLRSHFFTNSVTVIHEAECIEWFYPLLKPYCHYIPTDIFFNDLEDNIKWALANDDICQQIVVNANNFAKKYLNESAMQYAFNKTLKSYADFF